MESEQEGEAERKEEKEMGRKIGKIKFKRKRVKKEESEIFKERE